MGKGKSKGGFYAVAKGRSPGVYTSWDDCEAQVKGIAGARYKKFASLAEAQAFAGQTQGTGPGRSSSKTYHSSGSNPSKASSSSLGQSSRVQPYPRPSSLPMKGPIKMTSTAEIAAEEKGWDVVYSDGACKGNGQPGSIAGVGVWWGHNDPRNIAERCPGSQTNNRAELIAIVRVLETTPICSTPLMIKTDSKYSINCLTVWWSKWVWNNFRKPDGSPVKNKEILQYLATLLELRHVKRQKVQFVHVRGHAGIEGNEGADYQANLGATMEERIERDWVEERENVKREIDAERDRGAIVGPAQVEVKVVEEDDKLWEGMEEPNDVDDLDSPEPAQHPSPGPSATPKTNSTTEKATQTPAQSRSIVSTVAKAPSLQRTAYTKPKKNAIGNEDDEDAFWEVENFDLDALDAELRAQGL